MEFNISTVSIQRAFKVLSIVVKANALDSSGMVLIEAKDNCVVFTSNNGSTAISLTIVDVEVKEVGEIAILYSKIKSFISSFKPWDGAAGVEKFSFISTKRETKIKVESVLNNKKSRSSLKVTTLNPAVISKISDIEEVNFTINSTILRSAISKVLYAVNPQVGFNQPALQGMNINFDDDSIFFAGSDGIVLSEYQTTNNSEFKNGNITLQYDFIMGLRRLINDDSQLLWEVKGNKVSVKFDDILYSGRKIIGHEFPDYRVTFDKYTHQILLEKEFLISSLSPVIDILDPDDNFRITMEIKDTIFRFISTQSVFESELDISKGLDFSIDINGKYLIQTIESINDDTIVFKFSDSDGFAIFDSKNNMNQKSLISSIRKR
jgi:DNA polymerase III sliding clamp (beta) subunit (PCNA family)